MRRKSTITVAALLVALLIAVFGPASRAAAKAHMDMTKMIETAKTPADHEKLAAMYEQEAKDAHAKAEMHRKMADAYRKQGGAIVSKLHFDEHCDGLVKSFTAAAQEC